MDADTAAMIVRDFDDIFSHAEQLDGVVWCHTRLYPPNGKNTKENRAVLEFMINNLLIGHYKCLWSPMVRLGWDTDHYRIGMLRIQRTHPSCEAGGL